VRTKTSTEHLLRGRPPAPLKGGASISGFCESTFEIWLAPLELLAVDLDGALVVSAPRDTVGWVARRFGRILDSAAERAERRLRIADELERRAAETLSPTTAPAPAEVSVGESDRSCGFAPEVSADASSDPPVDGSVYPSSYTDVCNQFKNVS
jgi:hypothetical protein